MKIYDRPKRKSDILVEMRANNLRMAQICERLKYLNVKLKAGK